VLLLWSMSRWQLELEPSRSINSQNNTASKIYSTYRGGGQAQPTHCGGHGFVVEIRNSHGTFDSHEVSSKHLEDKGAAKEPLPFLKSITPLLVRRESIRGRIPFYHHVHFPDTKSEDSQGSTSQTLRVLHLNLVRFLGYHKTPRGLQCQQIQ